MKDERFYFIISFENIKTYSIRLAMSDDVKNDIFEMLAKEKISTYGYKQFKNVINSFTPKNILLDRFPSNELHRIEELFNGKTFIEAFVFLHTSEFPKMIKSLCEIFVDRMNFSFIIDPVFRRDIIDIRNNVVQSSFLDMVYNRPKYYDSQLQFSASFSEYAYNYKFKKFVMYKNQSYSKTFKED